MRLGKLGLLALLFPLAASAAVCPTGYSNSAVFAYPAQKSTLTSFPVLIAFNGLTPISANGISSATSYTLSALKASGSGGVIQSSGNDIVFCDAASGGNLLNFDRAQYSGTTGAAEFWVTRTLSSTAVTYIWMFYGKASDTDHSNAAAAWANYGLVVHAPNGSTLTLADSTGTNSITNSGATAVTGQIGGAMAVSGTGPKYATVADNASIKPTTGLTYSAWIYPTSNVTYGMIVTKNNGTDASGYDLYLGNGTSSTQPNCQSPVSGAVNTLRASASLSLNTWHRVTCTMTGTPNSSTNYKMYVDGAEVTSFASATYNTSSIATNTNALGIGARSSGTAYNGEARIDEVRVSSTMQSADWIAAEYLNQSYPTAFGVMTDDSAPASMTSGAYCVPLTVNHAQVPNTDQTNFPLLVHGVYGWMADTSHGGFAVTGNSGKDIRFYSDSGCSTTALNFQRVYWTNTTGDASFRVRIPTLSHTSDTTVYVRIGSSSDTSDLSTTWEASYGYAAVYAGSDPSTLSGNDSGGGGLTLGCGASATAALTPVGGGFYVGATGADTSTCGNAMSVVGDRLSTHGYPTGSNAGHIRYWFRNTPSTASGGTNNDVTPAAYGKANGTGQRGLETEYRACQLNGLGELQFSASGPGVVAESGSCTSSTPNFAMDQGWHVFDFDQPTNGATYGSTALYYDGVKITTPVYIFASSSQVINTDDTPCCTNNAEVRIGRMAAHGAAWFTGYVGQFEVTNFSQNQDTVQARYNNELSPSTFYSFGAAVPFSGGGSSSQPHILVTL